jgi:WD40-like Beta Propeller Repeat
LSFHDGNRLTTPDRAHGESDHLFPSVLPGNRGILFTIVPNGPVENAQIAVLDPRTNQQKILIRGGSQAEYVDGGYIVYTAGGALRAVRFDPARLEVLGDPVPVLEQVQSAVSGAAQFAVTHTGALVYAPGGGVVANHSLVWVSRQGREDPIKAPPRAYYYPRLSPDGSRVAVDIRDQENDIWVWEFSRETLTRLTFDPGQDEYPVWTPDGRRVAFASTRAGSFNLFWQAADGTGTADRLTTSPNIQYPFTFTPDGITERDSVADDQDFPHGAGPR